MSERRLYVSPNFPKGYDLVILGMGQIAEILDRLKYLLKLLDLPAAERIAAAEVRDQVQKLTRRHSGALTPLALSARSDLPDPGVRPTYGEAQKDGSLASAIGFILRTRGFVEGLEAQYGLAECGHA